MSMLFQKRSTRTRVSTESGFAALGGHALFLGALLLCFARARARQPLAARELACGCASPHPSEP